MEMSENMLSPDVLTTLIIGASVVLIVYILKLVKSDVGANVQEKNKPSAQPEKKKEAQKQQGGKKSKTNERWNPKGDTFTHHWVLTTLKGHTGEISDMDYSSNGKYLASCGYDKAVFLWDLKDLTKHRSLRVNTEYNWPIFVKWSPDSKAFVIYRQPNDLEVYKIQKKENGWLGSASKALHFQLPHKDEVVGMSIANSGKFIMTCSKDNALMVWDLKGNILAVEDTYLMTTVCAKISPCSRFIVASGFSPHATVWEVIFKKDSDSAELKRVFELKGHTSGVYDVAFDVDTSHMATVSKDGHWKIYDTNIDYKRGQDPRVKITGDYRKSGDNAKIALSPNAEVVVISASSTLYFYNAISGSQDIKIENVFSNGPISNLMFDSTGKYVFASGEKHIRVFHNITGYKCAIEDSKDKLKKKQTSATKERLQEIISESQKIIDMVEKAQKN